MKFNKKYLPISLTRKDSKKQQRMLMKSHKLYKNRRYMTRGHLDSFKSKTSRHIINARRIYGIQSLGATNELAKATMCTRKSLKKIIRKGNAAYYSSGSRPNQTPQSWGLARLGSAITGGKAFHVDYKILKEGCHKNSKVFKHKKTF